MNSSARLADFMLCARRLPHPLEMRVSYHLSLLHRIASHCSGIPFWFFHPHPHLGMSRAGERKTNRVRVGVGGIS
jgi:hypothetical protein